LITGQRSESQVTPQRPSDHLLRAGTPTTHATQHKLANVNGLKMRDDDWTLTEFVDQKSTDDLCALCESIPGKTSSLLHVLMECCNFTIDAVYWPLPRSYGTIFLKNFKKVSKRGSVVMHTFANRLRATATWQMGQKKAFYR
jgi:hypothetical protein